MDERIIRMKLDQLAALAVRDLHPIAGWQARTADHLGPGEYRFDSDWRPAAGDSEWPAGKTLFLRAEAEAPAGIPPAERFLQFDASGLEGLLSVDGRPYAGIDPNHLRVPFTPSGRVALEAEFMCVGASLSRPELRRETARLRQAAFARIDAGLQAAWYDLWFTWEAAQQARDARRQLLLNQALEAALLRIDLTAPPAELSSDAAGARALLRDRVGAIAPDPEAGRVFLTGHSHIDTAWLWPLRETIRKCGRTFATACRLLERYPDYHFSCSQPQLYEYARQHFPSLYQEIKGWVEAGRWECTGGMWVEADCNVPSGEALVRQILHGLRFFRQEFGARPRTCWLPDVFGYPASLPQILHGCGLENFYTNKLHWQSRNPFPAHLFWWQGIDGTRILAHIPKLRNYYNGWPNPRDLAEAWDGYHQKAAYPEVMLPFGFGDGGGGPTLDMLEFAARATRFPGLPAARQGLEEAYFDDARAAGPELPVWVGELYLETHRGTYTTQAAIKRANRKSELLLREAEILGALANLHGAAINLEALRQPWQELLLLQFHDILPGSSIGTVYQEAAASHDRIAAQAAAVRDAAAGSLAARLPRARLPRGAGAASIAVFNTLSWPRDDAAVARLPDTSLPAGADALEVVDSAGNAAPAQVIARGGGQAEVAFALPAAPALGCAVLSVRPAARPADHALRVAPRAIENRFFLVELDDDGEIARLVDKRRNREVVPAGQRANQLQLFQDGPEREAAWNVHDTFEKRAYAWDGKAELAVGERGPVRASIRIARRFRDSRVEQDLILYDRLPRIDFVTRADWQARQVMLKAAFPVDVLAPSAAYEIQFGAVERPTHRNTSWDQARFEVCAHRWADLSEAGYGVSLMNDCKYGYDVKDNVLRLTLLRGAEWPDPDADRGSHAFTYALLPHDGDWRAGRVVERAWELNAPLLCVNLAEPSTANQPGALPAAASFIELDGPAILEALKPADDGQGWILRVYEPRGGRGPVRITTEFPLARVIETNLVEEPVGEVACDRRGFAFAIRPYEIKTFRLSSSTPT